MIHLIKPHLKQFSLYFVSGTIANLTDIVGFWLLLWSGTYYLHATYISGTAGFMTAFLLHKYIVFQKREKGAQHFVRFILLGIFNLFAVAGVLWVCVEFMGIPEEISKVLANGSQVLWGFIIMKLLVYV